MLERYLSMLRDDLEAKNWPSREVTDEVERRHEVEAGG
jgi:hypothetical protein